MLRERSTSVLGAIVWFGIALLASVASAQQSACGTKYAVASGHPAATAAGLNVLRSGGNVVDAAIAASLALGVAEPYGSGLGGKLILLYRDGASGEITSLVALCTAPAGLDSNAFANLHHARRQVGYLAVGVPGLLAGLDEAHRRWGSTPWRELVEPAAE
ncbi:MAG: gamma-glutamyltransferase, partial [Cephaloticoccus sp.]|nr:gamma-glutamyltransferase [Cephaloticoccus sp.]